MNIVFFLASALCLGYFLLIVLYSGTGTDFCGIWIAIALVFLLMGIFHSIEKKDRNGMPKRFPVFVDTSFVLLFLICSVILVNVARYAALEDTEGCDYLIVIGERVYEDGISSTLKKRLDRARIYAEDNPGTILVLSGGTDTGDALPEALAMYNYLALLDVAEDRMLIEAESDTTAENLAKSMEIIDKDLNVRMVPPPIMIGILTSDYHIYRTLKTAEDICGDGIYPVTAESDPILFAHQCIRECAALIRDHLTGPQK